MPSEANKYAKAKEIINRTPASHKQAKESHDYERLITSLRIDRLKENPIEGDYDFKHLAKIHKEIFNGLYDHAGKKRPKTEIWSKKGHSALMSVFADIDDAESLIEDARKLLEICKRTNNREEFINKFTEAYAFVNHAHPFEEGNGRATRHMFMQFAKEQGYNLDLSPENISKQEWDFASIKSGRHQQLYERGLVKIEKEIDLTLLNKVMKKALKPLDRSSEIYTERLRSIIKKVYKNDTTKRQEALYKLEKNLKFGK